MINFDMFAAIFDKFFFDTINKEFSPCRTPLADRKKPELCPFKKTQDLTWAYRLLMTFRMLPCIPLLISLCQSASLQIESNALV